MKPQRSSGLFLGLVMAVAFLASCGGAAKTPAATPPPPQEILRAAYEAGLQPTTAHFDMDMSMTIQMEGTKYDISAKLVGDMATPDRLKGTLDMSVMGQSIKTDMVVVGDTAYVKNPDTGEWETTTQEQAGLDPQAFVGLKPEEIQDLKLVGQESLGGRQVYHLSGRADLDLSVVEGLDMSMTGMLIEYWIDKETSHTLKAVVTGQMQMTVQGTEATVDMDATVLLSDYGKAVTIEAPQ